MSKILFVTNMYPSKKYPAYGIFVKKTEDILKRENIVKTIGIIKRDNVLVKFFAYGMFFCKVIIVGCIGRHDMVYANFASHTSLPVRVLKRIRPSLRIITNVHGNDVVPLNKKDACLLSQTQRLLNVSDLVVVPSEYFSDIVKRDFGISKKKVFVFPSAGIDVEIFRKIDKIEAKRVSGLDVKDRYIGFISRIDAKKGWDIFLHAAKIIHSKAEFIGYKYIIAGYGKEYNQMEELAHKLGLDEIVILIKNVNRRNLPYLYNALDVFVFASFMPSESLGLVGLEAMACEQVVVAPDKYGPATYAKNKVNSYTFRTGDYDALAVTVMDALKMDINLRNRLCNNARCTAMRYNEKVVSGELLNMIKELAKNEEKSRK